MKRSRAWTKTDIIELLRTHPDAVGRALIALTDRQTADEVRQKTTKYHNDKGFRPCHALRGTDMAAYYKRNGYLTRRQLAWWRAPTAKQGPRIEIYAAQLAEIANAKRG